MSREFDYYTLAERIPKLARLMAADAETHYIPACTEAMPRDYQRAVCGAVVTIAKHSTEPACERCRAWLAQ